MRAMGCTVSSEASHLAETANSHNLPRVSASHADHRKHHWFRLDLPNGIQTFSGGNISVQWKDQGWGNRKGHLWARFTAAQGDTSPWARISTHVAPHTWTREEFALPATWFAEGRHAPVTLELAFEVGGGGGHALHVQEARLTLTPRARKAVER